MKRRGSKLILSAILMIFYTYNYDIDVTPFLHTSDDSTYSGYIPCSTLDKNTSTN